MVRTRLRRCRRAVLSRFCADLRRDDTEVPAKPRGEVAVACVAEVEGEIGEIDVGIAQTVERQSQAELVAVTRQCLSGARAKGAAEFEGRKPDGAGELAERQWAREVTRQDRAYLFDRVSGRVEASRRRHDA